MTRKLHISPALSLPSDAVTATQVVYGGKGMGKTNFGGVLAEEMSRAESRFCVVDPMGVWWGLRHAEDGKGPGVECLILGGPHGDIPIEPTGGEVVADLVVNENVNVIIDVSRTQAGIMWKVGQKIQFMIDFGQRLYELQGSLVGGRRREPICVIVDEAARFIPQIIRSGQPQLAQCASIWATIGEEGRNFGLGVVFITQRSARLNKDVAELADVMIAFRTVGPNSIAAIMDWMGEHVPKEHIKELVEQLRKLPIGTCLLISPGWLQKEEIVPIRARTTFDSSATPKPGERSRKITGKASKPDLAKYSALMQETIERVKESDPTHLKRRIAELTKQLEMKAAPAPAPQAVGKAPVINLRLIQRAVEAAVRKSMDSRDQEWSKALIDYQGLSERVVDEQLKRFNGALHTVKFNVPTPIKKVDATVELKEIVGAQPGDEKQPARKVENNGARRKVVESNGEFTAPQIRILAALASMRAIGRNIVKKGTLAALVEASSTSSSFTNNLGALRSLGMIDYPQGGTAALTKEGEAVAPSIDPPSTADEMLEYCKNLVPNPQERILEALREKYPSAVDKQELAQIVQASVTSSSFTNNLGALRSAGMIDYPAKGQAKLESWVMLEDE